MSQHKNSAMAAVASVAGHKNIARKQVSHVRQGNEDAEASSSVTENVKGQAQDAACAALDKIEETRANVQKVALETAQHVARIASCFADTQKESGMERMKGSITQMQTIAKDLTGLFENSRQNAGTCVADMRNKAIEAARELATLNLATIEKCVAAGKVADLVDAHASYYRRLPSVYGEYVKGLHGCLTQSVQSGAKPFSDFYKNCMNAFSCKK